ncbi:nucleotidyltransferase domain-containing protein [Cellulomonas hominis]
MQVQEPLSTVTPTLDGPVLTVLAQADAAFTPGQIQRVLATGSLVGIRAVLSRLHRQGVVDAEPVGHAVQYRLNREHLAADHIIALAHQQTELFRRLEEAIGVWPVRPVYGAVFGSTARGAMHEDSDIDLFLVRPDGAAESAWEQQSSALAALVTRWTGNDTRILDMSEAEVRATAGREPVLDSVAEEGRTVCGSPAWLRQIVRRREVEARGAREDGRR